MTFSIISLLWQHIILCTGQMWKLLLQYSDYIENHCQLATICTISMLIKLRYTCNNKNIVLQMLKMCIFSGIFFWLQCRRRGHYQLSVLNVMEINSNKLCPPPHPVTSSKFIKFSNCITRDWVAFLCGNIIYNPVTVIISLHKIYCISSLF